MRAASRAAVALIFCGTLLQNAFAFPAASLMEQEVDGEGTRKVLGSSVVTSVSVIMDLGNGSQGFADATGRPVEKPASADHLASPPSLMSPDRYEFYTFNDAGDLVKRLMTMDEIQGLIAGESVEIGSDLPGIEPEEAGHGEERPGSFFYLPHPLERTPDWSPPGVDKVVKRVQDVLADVQNRITLEEGSSAPSWGINRPNVPNPPLHPTQNIPGSILHLLKDTPEKVSTFVPPVQSFSTPKPDSESNVSEGILSTEESTVAPSSTPILPPVSSTIEVTSTTQKLEASSTEAPAPTENSKIAGFSSSMPVEKTTSAPLDDENYVPVAQIKPESDPPAITIPSTIIADLLIEDMHEKIKHTAEPPKITLKPIAEEKITATTSAPLNADREASTSTTTAPVTKSTSASTSAPVTKSTTTTTTAPETKSTTPISPEFKLSTTQYTEIKLATTSVPETKPITTEQTTTNPPEIKSTTNKTPDLKVASTIKTETKLTTVGLPETKLTTTNSPPTTVFELKLATIKAPEVKLSTTETPVTKSTTLKATEPTTAEPTTSKYTITVPIKTATEEKLPATVFTKITTLSPVSGINSTHAKVNATKPAISAVATTENIVSSTATPLPTTQKASTLNLLRTPSATTVPPTTQNSKPVSGFYITKRPTVAAETVKTTTQPAEVAASAAAKQNATIVQNSTTSVKPIVTSTTSAPTTNKPAVESDTKAPPKTTVRPTTTVQTSTTSKIKPTTVKEPASTTQNPTPPPLEDLKAQVNQIAQSLTDKKATSVRPIPVANAGSSTFSSSSSTTASFGSSYQTGKTTPPVKVTSSAAPTTTEKSTTIQYVPIETTTDPAIYETQMTTLNEPLASDNLVFEDITSKTSDFEITSESLPENDGLSNEYELADLLEDDTSSFESTEKTETNEDVPFISQIFGDENRFDSEETAPPTTVTPEIPSSTQSIAVSTTTKTTPVPKTTTTPEKSPTGENKIKVFTTEAAKITSTDATPTTKKVQPPAKLDPKPLAQAQTRNETAAIEVSKPTDIKQEVNTQSTLVGSGAGQISSTQNPTQTQTTKPKQDAVTTTATKTTNLRQDDYFTTEDEEDMELVSTTEYFVHPSTIKHASSVKLETKGPASAKPMANKLDRERIKEVLDQILDTAGILNLGDSSEEAVREEIYTTFIPASTTAKNTSPQSNNASVALTNKTEAAVIKNPEHNSTTETHPESITDLEVSWQEPPEVVWTDDKPEKTTHKQDAEKYTPAPAHKKTTASKTTTPAPSTKSPTSEPISNNIAKDSLVYTKSNDDGMELISTSDQIKSSTPVIRTPQKPYLDVASPEIVLKPASINNLGLEATTVMLDEDVRRFIDLSNDIGIRLYKHTTSDLDKRRSIAISPFGATSLIGMVFIGARGQTSAQINDFLPFDDMITFNPHLVMRNITDSVIMSPDLLSAAIVRELYSQKGSKQPLDFYKARASAFYDGLVQQVDFDEISRVVRERTNELVKTQTSNKVPAFLGDAAVLRLNPPFAALSANVFQMNCALSTSTGRDGEMIFHGEKEEHALPSTVWSGEFMYGYDVGLDATAVEIPHSNSPAGALTSTVFVMPGKPGSNSYAGVPLLARLEARLISRRAWSGLLRNLQRTEYAIDVQVPRFEHRSVLNLTVPLSRMGLKDLFAQASADLRGVNGIQELYLSDITQMNVFSICSTPDAEGHVETYPSSKRTGRLGSRGGEDEEDDYDWRTSSVLKMPLPLRPRQARIPMSDNPRLKIDRPFMYFIRHNPTGMILHIGRFNPRDEP